MQPARSGRMQTPPVSVPSRVHRARCGIRGCSRGSVDFRRPALTSTFRPGRSVGIQLWRTDNAEVGGSTPPSPTTLTCRFVAPAARSGALAPHCTTAGAPSAGVSRPVLPWQRDLSMAATPKLLCPVWRAASGWVWLKPAVRGRRRNLSGRAAEVLRRKFLGDEPGAGRRFDVAPRLAGRTCGGVVVGGYIGTHSTRWVRSSRPFPEIRFEVEGHAREWGAGEVWWWAEGEVGPAVDEALRAPVRN